MKAVPIQMVIQLLTKKINVQKFLDLQNLTVVKIRMEMELQIQKIVAQKLQALSK